MVFEWVAIIWLTNKKLTWLKAVPQTLLQEPPHNQLYECSGGRWSVEAARYKGAAPVSQNSSTQGSSQSSRQSQHDLLAQISKFKHDSDGNLVFR